MENNENIKYKKILIETFKAFANFCDQHNLKYFACGGTAIGAIRHQGIIPWDDDIDVCMLRDDYNRFIELKSKCIDTNYRIVDYNNEGYYLPFAKFINNNTTIWEKEEYPFIIGVFIDIFPLNTTNGSYKENKIIQKQYNHAFSRYIIATSKYQFKDLIESKIQFNIKLYLKYLILKPFKKILFKKFAKIDNQIKNNKEGNYLLNYFTPYKIEKELFPKEWFTYQIAFPFEDTTINLPKGYHEYLTQLFGDYMTPPPIEKQISHHYRYYYNLDKRLTTDEIRLLKRNEKHQSK